MTVTSLISQALRSMDIIPSPGDPDWPIWNARLQAGLDAINRSSALGPAFMDHALRGFDASVSDSQLGISIRFIREYDATKDLLRNSVFPPRAPWVQQAREADEPKVSPDVAAYLDDWFAK